MLFFLSCCDRLLPHFSRDQIFGAIPYSEIQYKTMRFLRHIVCDARLLLGQDLGQEDGTLWTRVEELFHSPPGVLLDPLCSAENLAAELKKKINAGLGPLPSLDTEECKEDLRVKSRYANSDDALWLAILFGVPQLIILTSTEGVSDFTADLTAFKSAGAPAHRLLIGSRVLTISGIRRLVALESNC